MSTYSTFRWEDVFYCPLNGRLEGYGQSKIPRLPRAASYSPKILDMIGSLQRQMAGEPYNPYQKTAPPLQAEEGVNDLKRTNFGNDPRRKLSTPWLVPADGISPPVCPSRLSRRPRPMIKCAQGLFTVDKHHSLWALGSVGLTRLAWRGVAVGTHTCL
jgi:hypothetical protein